MIWRESRLSQSGADGPAQSRRARRRVLGGAVALLATGLAPAAFAHGSAGPVTPPIAASAEPLTTARGVRTTLARLLNGAPTALQFMFTGCSDICPIQGAMFAELQRRLARDGPADARLLSISIDALGDGPAQLAQWLKKHSAAPGWDAAVPAPDGVERLLRLLNGPGGSPLPENAAGGFATHGAQVFLFDRRARLVWRTTELPEPEAVLDWFRQPGRG